MIKDAQDIIPNIPTGVSFGAFGVSWLPIMTDVAQLFALVVAIAAGVAGYRLSNARRKVIEAKKNNENKK